MLSRTTVVLYLLLATVFSVSQADARPAQPGRAWVQSHSFQISAAAMSHTYWNVNTYKACNLNACHPWQLLPNYPHGNTVILNSCKSNGVMIHPDIRGTHLHSGLINFINSVSNSSSDFAWYVMDEPPSSMFPGIADVVNWLKTNRPNGLIYLGTADTTDAYLDPMIAQIQPDALSFCCYPYYLNTTRLDWWWRGTSRIRNKTLYHGIPYFAWIQAFAGDGQWRIPTEGDVRMQVFSSLTAGAKGIFYWMWDRDQWPDWTYTMTDIGGAPNTLYYQIQGINVEVANLGNSLRFLHSADLRYVRGWKNTSSRNSVPDGLSNWSYGAGGNSKITNVDVVKGDYGAEKDGLIGLFNYDGPDPQYSGMQYFMLTNVYRSDSLNFTVTFDSSVNVLHRLSRATGQWVAVYPSGNTLNLNLPAGTGELFAIVEGSGPSPEPDDPFTDDRFCSIDLGTTNVSNKLTHPQNSDGDTTATNAGGLNCRRPVDSGDQYFYFAIDDSFLYDLPGTTTYLEVSYFDDQPSAAYLCPQYDSTSSAYTNAAPVYFTNSGKWKISTWALTGCKFANRQNAGADFRIYVGQYSVKIDSVRVSKVPFSDYNTVGRDLGANEEYRGLSHPFNWSGSDGKTVVVEHAGVSCRKPQGSGDNYFYFNVSDAIMFNGNPSTVYLKVEYFDSPGGLIRPEYDSNSGAYTAASTLNFAGTNTWRHAHWTLTNVRFANNQNGSADFRLYVGTNQSVHINRVWVSKQAFPVDTESPSTPTNLQATAQSETSVQLTWTASTDNVGVTGYKIFRNGVQIATSGTNSYLNTGLAPATTYSYRVSAYDAAGNESSQSSQATVTTPDNTAPSVPTNLSATAQSETSAQLTWTASTDNVGVTGYKIFRNGVQIATSGTNSYLNTGLAPATTYSYRVSAYDAAGNESSQSAQAVVTTPDNTAPSVPTNVSATAQSETSVQLTWTASTDNVGVTGYKIFRNGVQIATSGTNSYLNTGLAPATTYSYRVSAYDAAGNESSQSSQAVVTTPDNTPPCVPTNVQAVVETPKQVKVSWTASTDNVAVTGYKVFRNGVEIGTSTTTSYTDTGLTPATSYSYTVSAYDAAGNNSAQSSPAVAATLSAVDVASAKQLANGATAGLVSQIVTAVFDDFIYIEAADRYAGIRVKPVSMPTGLALGVTVDVGGTLQTVNGERQIGNATVVITGTGSVEPLGLNNSAVGGGDWEYNSATGAGQRGISGATGTNNIGLLITTWGSYTQKDATTSMTEAGIRSGA